MSHTVLLIDDEPNVLEGLSRSLHKESYEILTASSAEDAAHVLQDNPVDLIVTDEEMPGMSGTEFLARVAKEYPDIVRIVLTGHPTMSAALRAINEGKVYQFFMKPCNEIDLAIAIRHALEQKDLLLRSKELLEVTKRQSALIDEARLLRRLRSAPRKERSDILAKEGEPIDPRELLDQMDEEVRRSKTLLESLRDDVDVEV